MFYDVMAAVAYAIAVPIALFAGPLITLLFGPQFVRTVGVLQIHVISLVFAALGIARGRYLIAQNMLGFTLGATYFGAVLNVGLNLILLPRYGATGAAWATVIAYAGSNYFSGLLWKPMWGQTVMLTRALLFPIRLVATRGKPW
jgi:O-antigen/teichoic acid export membrane protein